MKKIIKTSHVQFVLTLILAAVFAVSAASAIAQEGNDPLPGEPPLCGHGHNPVIDCPPPCPDGVVCGTGGGDSASTGENGDEADTLLEEILSLLGF